MQIFKAAAMTIFLALTLANVGCNTARGVGQDVQETGEVIEDAAD